jgi:hypothetical protein
LYEIVGSMVLTRLSPPILAPKKNTVLSKSNL